MPAFSLLTFNTYGVPAPGTSARLRTLSHMLNEEAITVICLQEVQTHVYRRLIQTTTNFPHSAYEPFVHCPKGGLLTLSRLPINSCEYVLFNERGLWYTPALADWILHKGMLVSRMAIGDLPVVVINTHLTANYMGNWGKGSLYAEHEYQQLLQLAELVQAQPLDALVIVAGDFNVPRGSWLYESFLSISRLKDPLQDNLEPTIRQRVGIPSRYFMPIDYVLFRSPPLPGCEVRSRFRFQEKVVLSNGRREHLSDHIAIELCLTWDD
jgi:endonuclease/exonuclease/phosphatase family metal-dependent hydrolase